MVRARLKMKLLFSLLLLVGSFARVRPQDSDASPLNSSGHAVVDGQSFPYLIRHLPVNAYPQLPPAVKERLTHRGCLIPQTYEARQPENVLHASLERHGSSDWAVLCSVNGTVSLLVFLSSRDGEPSVLASAPETSRLQSHGTSNVLGFNWSIDPASPEQIHDAQLGMRHPPARLDHDALSDSAVDHNTIYRFYSKDTWTVIDTQD
jgi:hypothetical protein